jgi:pantothenate synthetase
MQVITIDGRRRLRNQTNGRKVICADDGYLHEGHLSIVRKAREENDLSWSYLVNLTQFGPNEASKYRAT